MLQIDLRKRPLNLQRIMFSFIILQINSNKYNFKFHI